MTKALRDGFPLISRRNGVECLFELATAVVGNLGRRDCLLISGRSGNEQWQVIGETKEWGE